MAELLDRISDRKTGQTATGPRPPSPLPTINETINKPPARPLTTTPLSQRISQIPQRGAVGQRFPDEQRRFVADLPEKEQIEGINSIIGGEDSASSVVNNFVRGMVARGKTPQEIRQAFIEREKTLPNPLVI